MARGTRCITHVLVLEERSLLHLHRRPSKLNGKSPNECGWASFRLSWCGNRNDMGGDVTVFLHLSTWNLYMKGHTAFSSCKHMDCKCQKPQMPIECAYFNFFFCNIVSVELDWPLYATLHCTNSSSQIRISDLQSSETALRILAPTRDLSAKEHAAFSLNPDTKSDTFPQASRNENST